MKRIRIGQVGLGRVGYTHAKNIVDAIPDAELTALCIRDEGQLKKIQKELDVPYVFTDYSEMVQSPEIDAVVIASPTPCHMEHIILALGAGKHVFTEKPLGIDMEQCRKVEKTVEAHPELKFMVGFMRRFDVSYQKAKEKIDNGDIGRIILVRSYTQDPIWNIESAISYAPESCGQFVDMCIHDIDLIRWFTGGAKVKKLWGIGGCYEFQEYKKWDDGKNVSALIQFDDETMGFLFAGRAAAHGTNVETEIIGTCRTLRIGSVGTDSMLEVLSKHGICRECYTDFQKRWKDAYISEIGDFVNCIIKDSQPATSVYDGTKALETAFLLKHSFETNTMITI